MQRLESSPRFAAHFSLAFISVEIRLTRPRVAPPESQAEVAAARQALDRTLAAERRQAEARLLLHG